MRKMTVNLSVVFISMIIITLMFTGTCHAEIDLDACIGAWLLDENGGDEALDWSGKENHGEISNADWAEGKFGSALEFDGVSSKVVIQDSDVLNDVEEITILAWAYLRRIVTSGTWNALVGKNPYPNGYLMWIQIPSVPSGLVYSPGRFDNPSTVEIDTDRWYHLAFTRNVDGGMKFYIDGELTNESQSNAGPITVIPGPLAIGGQSPQVLDGFVDEVILFNNVLEEEDVNKIMRNGLEMATAVSAEGKLAATWANIKAE